jgi:hypothetical protein
MNIFESFKKKNLKEVMDKNKYTQEEQYDTVIQLTDLSLREIVFQARDYLSEEDFSMLEDMISKENLTEEDLANINKFIVEKGMPEDVINKIIEEETNEYASLLDELE